MILDDPEDTITTSAYFDPVPSRRVVSQPSCDDQDQGSAEGKSVSSLKSGHSKYSLEQRRNKRACRRPPAHDKEQSILEPEQEPISRSALPSEPPALGLSQVTTIGHQSCSQELSMEALFEDLLGDEGAIRYLLARLRPIALRPCFSLFFCIPNTWPIPV